MEVVGLAAILVGAWFIMWPVAVLVGGMMLVVGANMPPRPAHGDGS